MTVRVVHGDCLEVLAGFEPESFSACCCDPPYEISMMGRAWDKTGVAFRPETWAAVLRVLKPGAFLAAMGGTRTFHRLVCAIEDAGFEIRDTVCWVYGAGFPKSLDVSKAIDRAAGAKREVKTWYPAKAGGIGFGLNVECPECGKWLRAQNPCRCPRDSGPTTEAAKQWQGWGTALKPAIELICLARKPLSETTSAELLAATGWDHWCSHRSDGDDRIITALALHAGARSYRSRMDREGREVTREDLGEYVPFALNSSTANVLKHGTGALNIEAGRVATDTPQSNIQRRNDPELDATRNCYGVGLNGSRAVGDTLRGRWPANLAHSGDPSVLAAFDGHHNGDKYGGGYAPPGVDNIGLGDIGSPARFFKACPWEPDEVLFYSSKAPRDQRFIWHPTVKPVSLMIWLVGMLCPPDGRLVDPFCGTGSTLVAADRLGIEAVGIEQDAQTCADAEEKIRRLRARRHIGEADRAPPLPGQLSLL